MKKILLFALFVASTINVNAQVTVNFPNTTWGGAYLSKAYDPGKLQGVLTSINVNVVLNASTSSTWADDFTVIVTTGLGVDDIVHLQAGGASDFGALESAEWPTGGSSTVGTVCNGVITLLEPIDFTANQDLQVWFGNGYSNATGTNSGSWSGSFTLNGVSEVLSTSDFTASKFSVYPNPANDIVTISNDANFAINAVTVSDLNGRTVKSVKLNGESSAQVNVSDLAAGIYMMDISSDQGTATKKIVKK